MLVIHVSAAIPGDANGDGRVNGADYFVWTTNYGQTTTLGSTRGDFDTNGSVNGADYAVWLNNYGIIETTPSGTPTQTSTPTLNPTPFTFVRSTNPSRTLVYDNQSRWLATFTDSARTVTLKGPERVFSEPSNTTYTVTHSTWVRLLPSVFTGTVDQNWLTHALIDTSSDILALGIQYIQGASSITNTSGLRIAGDADYGPLVNGARQEGSDFNDFLGLNWTYPNGTVDLAEINQFGSLDCSGFMRMIWGYRSGMPMSISPNGNDFPRRSFEMYESAPGIILISNTGAQVKDFGRLTVGDLVFFDADSGDGTQIDHTGMYIGIDSGGNHRFLSSRKTINGPTIGDVAGKSVLNGTGLYATSFRGVRRL